MTKQTMKFGVGALALVLLGLGALYVIRSYIPEYQARKAYEKLIEEYKNDPYGGETPEETLSLFIDALKKGDVELAAKYFVIDKQGEWKADLVRLKDTTSLEGAIVRLEKLQLTKKDEKRAYFELIIDNIVKSTLIIEIQSINGKWKISKL